MSKAIHEMNLKEAQSKLGEYQKEASKIDKQVRILSETIDEISYYRPDLLDCISILQLRIKDLTTKSLKGTFF